MKQCPCCLAYLAHGSSEWSMIDVPLSIAEACLCPRCKSGERPASSNPPAIAQVVCEGAD